MNTITELRNELSKAFSRLQEGDIEPKVMSELSNAAGKIINTTRVQIDYNEQRGEKRKIAFLECN